MATGFLVCVAPDAHLAARVRTVELDAVMRAFVGWCKANGKA